ncbi:11738_t:CDS:1 [Ambispora gerdemannii]|uniref:11738_t:CDS:1 n=1 Tax=Ambispora gerdemannii TaxID=144530 RepID=A0A9N9A4D0_9GLOM|nr:11738_t:CDS:1 [Ambispora gerdemannii]
MERIPKKIQVKKNESCHQNIIDVAPHVPDPRIVMIVHYRGTEDPDEAGQRHLNEKQITDLVPEIEKDTGMMIAEDQDLVLAIKEDLTKVDQGQALEIESDPIIEADHEIVITESTFGKAYMFFWNLLGTEIYN